MLVCFCCAIIIVAAATGVYFVKKTDSGAQLNKTTELGRKTSKESSVLTGDAQNVTASKTSTHFFVDIKGAVKKPGIYKATSKMRVADVVTAAGGLEKTADYNQVNLALKLTDQQVIYIPFKGEVEKKPPTTMEAGQSSTVEGGVVDDTEIGNTANNEINEAKRDLNKVTKDELLEIDGIGDKKADLILTYRTQHGGFKNIADLKNITGIGDKTFEKLNARLMVSP